MAHYKLMANVCSRDGFRANVCSRDGFSPSSAPVDRSRELPVIPGRSRTRSWSSQAMLGSGPRKLRWIWTDPPRATNTPKRF